MAVIQCTADAGTSDRPYFTIVSPARIKHTQGFMRFSAAVAVIAAIGLLAGRPASATVQTASASRRVILLTLDGVRPTEFFGGMDSAVVAFPDSSGIGDSARVWRQYWRGSPLARRRAVMPFFWDSLAPRAVVLGDPSIGGHATIANTMGFSAPGYLEILTGSAQPTVTSNDQIRYPFETILQFTRRKLKLGRMQVAAFTSWENFKDYVANRPDDVYVNAGFDTVPEPFTTPLLARLATLQSRALPEWNGSRLDAFTGGMALEFLRQHRPTLMYVAFNDTDDFAHIRKYDRVLDSMHNADDFIRELWHTLQSDPVYRGKTTLVITTDHGRGLTPTSWTDHGQETPGSSEIWMAVIGPGTGATTGARVPATQSQIAATVLTCLGLDPAEFSAAAASPLSGVCRK